MTMNAAALNEDQSETHADFFLRLTEASARTVSSSPFREEMESRIIKEREKEMNV